jgi:hypothetical protein
MENIASPAVFIPYNVSPKLPLIRNKSFDARTQQA